MFLCFVPQEGKGTRVVGADPDHPLDGSTFGLFNIFDSDDLWVSFAYTDVPPGASGAGTPRYLVNIRVHSIHLILIFLFLHSLFFSFGSLFLSPI